MKEREGQEKMDEVVFDSRKRWRVRRWRRESDV